VAFWVDVRVSAKPKAPVTIKVGTGAGKITALLVNIQQHSQRDRVRGEDLRLFSRDGFQQLTAFLPVGGASLNNILFREWCEKEDLEVRSIVAGPREEPLELFSCAFSPFSGTARNTQEQWLGTSSHSGLQLISEETFQRIDASPTLVEAIKEKRYGVLTANPCLNDRILKNAPPDMFL
jgi:hypothetical protein